MRSADVWWDNPGFFRTHLDNTAPLLGQCTLCLYLTFPKFIPEVLIDTSYTKINSSQSIESPSHKNWSLSLVLIEDKSGEDGVWPRRLMSIIRGHVHMMSAKFPGFLTPSLPLSKFVQFSMTPPPLGHHFSLADHPLSTYPILPPYLLILSSK